MRLLVCAVVRVFGCVCMAVRVAVRLCVHGCLRVCRVRWLCVRDCAWLWGNCGCTLGLLFASSDSGSDETVDCRAVIQISMIQFNGSQSYSSQLKSGMNPMIKARKLRAEGYHEQDFIRLNNKPT